MEFDLPSDEEGSVFTTESFLDTYDIGDEGA
jgi:hypothetical protein